MKLLLLLAAAPLFAQDCSTITAYSNPSLIAAAPAIGTVYVAAPDGCLWTYSSDSSWLSIVVGQPRGIGSGNGTLGWKTAYNIYPVQQVATISIVGTAKTLKLTVTQEAAPVNIDLALQPLSASYPVAGGTGAFQVQTNWAWSVGSSSSWITVPAATGGTTNGTVNYTVQSNPCVSGRSGSIGVQPASLTAPVQYFQIAQDGSPDNLSISPGAASVAAAVTDGRIAVTTGAGCAWSGYSDSMNWLQITSGASGGDAVTYHVVENTGTAARTGHIVIGPRTFTLTQAGIAPTPVQLTLVVNGASYDPAAVSPGEIVALGGTNLGPAKGVPYQLSSDQRSFSTTVAGTTVLFDGVPAALLYVSAAQVNAVVPYGVAGRTTTQVQVQYQGTSSNTLTVPVRAATPGIFTLDASGLGAGAILNQDYGVNSDLKPAARGSVVMIYCTGGGVTAPAGVDAGITTADPTALPRLTQDVSVTIGGIDAKVSYSGGAPLAVVGLTQINAEVPAGVTPGTNVQVKIKIGSWESRDGVIMAVK
ncbi:MAG: IPT/TIG domain-containing protein [Acidobacteriia bacterium]|nr:IPT/TIG domain-containing protein [Terriglobia bacterium]